VGYAGKLLPGSRDMRFPAAILGRNKQSNLTAEESEHTE
jgi:hypothetical protein